MMKGYKIRIYPTKDQERKIWQHIGACRFVWNYMLAEQIKRSDNGEKHLYAFDMNKMLPALKNLDECQWLKEASASSLQHVCAALDNAYSRFRKGVSGRPKFKSKKKSKQTFQTSAQDFYFDGRVVRIPKLGRVRYKSDFKFPDGRSQKFFDVRITCVNGKYMLSFVMECENQARQLSNCIMGIDLGVKELAVVACDDEQLVFHNINKSKTVRYLKKKIKHTKRSISRKYEASKRKNGVYVKANNIVREEQKLRKMHARLNGIRHNYLHQVTHTLVSMLPRRVTMEDLNVAGLMKNKNLSDKIQEQCFHEFIRQMRYKCDWNGIEFVQVPRFYPSSKTCSHCGSVRRELHMNERTFICNDCGMIIDRDYNAAINLMRYVDQVERATA